MNDNIIGTYLKRLSLVKSAQKCNFSDNMTKRIVDFKILKYERSLKPTKSSRVVLILHICYIF